MERELEEEMIGYFITQAKHQLGAYDRHTKTYSLIAESGAQFIYYFQDKLLTCEYGKTEEMDVDGDFLDQLNKLHIKLELKYG